VRVRKCALSSDKIQASPVLVAGGDWRRLGANFISCSPTTKETRLSSFKRSKIIEKFAVMTSVYRCQALASSLFRRPGASTTSSVSNTQFDRIFWRRSTNKLNSPHFIVPTSHRVSSPFGNSLSDSDAATVAHLSYASHRPTRFTYFRKLQPQGSSFHPTSPWIVRAASVHFVIRTACRCLLTGICLVVVRTRQSA
jgi:hypothetical protein